MQGIVITGPGTFEYRTDLPDPIPGPGEVRIRVSAAGICGTDVHIVRGDESLVKMLHPPVILGHEFCGKVDSWGSGVSGFTAGEYVTAEMHQVCSHCRACRDGKYHACEATKIQGLHANGAFADYVIVPATNVVKLPSSIPVKVGAILDALGNAVHTVSKTEVKGKIVAIIGYGAIGAMACEVARFLQASHIYIVEVNKRCLDRASAWIAREKLESLVTVVNGKLAHAREEIVRLSSGGCDVSLEFSGAPGGINTALHITRAGGSVSLLGIPNDTDVIVKDYGRNVIMKGLTIHGVIGREMYGTWKQMISMIEQGLDISPLITLEIPLREFANGLKRVADREEQKVILIP